MNLYVYIGGYLQSYKPAYAEEEEEFVGKWFIRVEFFFPPGWHFVSCEPTLQNVITFRD